jgi:hypothetical protein
LSLTTTADAIEAADAVIICAPTPVDADRRPDPRALRAACADAVAHARPGQTICGPPADAAFARPPRLACSTSTMSLQCELGLFWHRERQLTPVAEQLRSTIREICERLEGEQQNGESPSSLSAPSA